MAKPTKTAAAADSKGDNVSLLPAAADAPPLNLESLSQLTDFAVSLGVELSGTVEERLDSAALHMNRSQRHMLAAGVLLASIKADCKHGEFTELVEQRGFAQRSAQRAMQYAEFVLSRPESEREQLLGVSSSKVLLLASADPAVVESMLGDRAGDIDALSVDKLRQKLRDLEEQAADLAVQRDTAEAEADGLKKRLKRGLPDREDSVPVRVADLRAEVLALGKKAALALDSFTPLRAELIEVCGTNGIAHWGDASLRLAVSQLGALRLQLDGLLKTFLLDLPDEDPTPAKLSPLTKQEVLETARQFAELTQVHTYEAELRAWEREQARPQGKGRPRNKPEAPAAAEPAKAARGTKGGA